MKFFIFLLTILLSVSIPSAFAKKYAGDGQDLLKACQRGEGFLNGTAYSSIDYGYCFGYINGVVETSSFYQAIQKSPLYCFSKDADNGKNVRIVIRYLEDHEKELQDEESLANKMPSIDVIVALEEAYPCKKTNS